MRIKSKEFDFLSLWMCFVSKVTGDEAEGGEGEKPFLEKSWIFPLQPRSRVPNGKNVHCALPAHATAATTTEAD